MPTEEDIAQQRDLLDQQRRTLAHLLQQATAHGGLPFAPPATANGIAQARAAIARIKAWLRDHGEHADDLLGDEATDDEIAVRAEPVSNRQHAQTIGGHAQVGIAISGDFHGTVQLPSHATRPPIDSTAAQAQLDRLPLVDIPAPAALPPMHRMTLRPNEQFVGREDDLRALAAALKAASSPLPRAGEGPGVRAVAAITTGIGGVGKTQLAAEFAHRYGQFFAGGVFWLSFADAQGVDGEIAACGGAGCMELYDSSDELTQAEQVAKVYAEWEQDIPRLLIFDNCDDLPGLSAERQLADRLPRSGGCRVLVTSRHGQWRSGSVREHHLETLPRHESIALLRNYRADITDADADDIAAELGDLPLALTLAGSYLARYADDAIGQPATYLNNLRAKLLDHRSLQGPGDARSATNREDGVRAAFALSFDRLSPADPTDALAIAALARAACLAPGEPFPRDLLLATLGEASDDEDIAAQRADALLRLLTLGLLEVTQDASLRIHRLIVAFAQEAAQDGDAQAAIEAALTESGNRLANARYPARLGSILRHLRHTWTVAEPRSDASAAALANALARAEEALINYAAARPLYEHALSIRKQALGLQHPDTAASLSNLAGLFRAQGDYAAARPLYERALQVTEQVLEPTHPDTAIILSNLAGLLESQGDYAAARPIFERVVQIFEQALGPQHPDTVTSLNNLASLLERQGDYAAARTLYEHALAIREQTLGSLHPITASSLNNLASLLERQGDYAAARTLYEHALAIREQTLGPQHPDTATSLNNLAHLLQSQGDYAAARPLYERALALQEQILGPQHPITATSLNNLAYLLQSQGDYAAVRPLYERVVQIFEQALGRQHPDTATSLNNLAYLLQGQGDYAAARPMYERALSIREQVLGPNHPDTAISLNNLAGLLESQGDYAAARPIFERALQVTEKALGLQHPDTATSLNNLAYLLESQGDYPAARPLYERALQVTEQALGAQHPITATNLNNLAHLLQSQGDYPAARPLYERALSIREQALGPQHPDTATSLNNFAHLLQSQGDYPAARSLYERALSIREQALGPQHPDTAVSLNNLASLLESQGDYVAARPMYERALSIREQALGAQHPITATSLNNLAHLLQSQGDYAAAQLLYERALSIRERSLGPQHPTTAISLNNLAHLLQNQGDYAAARSLYERALQVTEKVLGPQHPDTATSLNNLASLLESQGDYIGAQLLYARALTICEAHFGADHSTTQTIRAALVALDAPARTAEQQIADLTAQAEAAVAQVLANPDSNRAALTAALEEIIQQIEAGAAEGSPYLALAAHLRALAAQLQE